MDPYSKPGLASHTDQAALLLCAMVPGAEVGCIVKFIQRPFCAVQGVWRLGAWTRMRGGVACQIHDQNSLSVLVFDHIQR